MKVLYATQATGNGHLVRALELIPILKDHVDLDVFVSGTQGQIQLPFKVDFRKYGLSFVAGKKGGISYFRTAKSLKLGKLIRDIKHCNVRDYDLIINDFEPITAWAARIKNVKTIALSHQAAFKSRNTPRPDKRNRTQEFILKNYAPTQDYLGFHFESYDDKIWTPIISRDIRELKCHVNNVVSVYLPSYSSQMLSDYFQKIPDFKWRIFSPFTRNTEEHNNVEINPVSREGWLHSFSESEALLIGAGFEGPSEALYHGKKLMVIPMRNQYEQLCNAEALKKLGINVQYEIQGQFESVLSDWLVHGQVVKLDYELSSEDLVKEVLQKAG